MPQVLLRTTRHPHKPPRLGPVCAVATLLMCCTVAATAQGQGAIGQFPTVRPLALNQTRYRLRAGESTRVDAPRETLDYLLHAKIRRVEIDGKEARGIVVGPNRAGDQVMLAASLTMKPGEYAVTVSAVTRIGDERAAAVDVTLDPMQAVPNGSTVPPVVLLNGLQLPSTLAEWLTFDTCPVSAPSDTFGPLATQLMESPSASVGNPVDAGLLGAGVPVVYFFDNCVEDPNGQIENLGNTLGQVISLIQYSNGTQVPQVDLVSHSMGGLIVRSYLAGLQTNGALSPPLNLRVRKFIEIATPNFGSFLAANWSYVIANGTQTSEMIPGSPFLWYLATWNQRGDDLRGVDALAIVGDKGYWQANNFSTDDPGLSDGVVSITSASLGFVPLSYARSPVRTRILPYCHVPPGLPIDCTGGGIARVDQAPETGAIVLSFLENTPDWQSIGNSNQTEYGGLYFALENAAGTQYTALENASLGSVSLNAGESASFFYNEFINGTGTLTATSTANQATNCGSFSVPVGYYTAVRCKFSPSISGVQSSLSTGLPGLTVASGSTITISGTGFSAGTSVLANGASLSAQIVSSQEITAFLPSTYSGLVGLAVSNSTGEDEISMFVAPSAQPPAISVSSTQLRFSYVEGGAVPATQPIQVTNSGGGTLTWSAATSATWLSVTPPSGAAPSTLSVSASPAGLAAGTFTGSVLISAGGASNSPVSVTVTLTVVSAPASLVVSPQALTFSYTMGGTVPAPQGVSVTNKGSGTLTWSSATSALWLFVTPAFGTAPSTLSVLVSPTGLGTGTYTGSVQISAGGASNSPVSVTVTLTVAPAPASLVVSPQALTFSHTVGGSVPAPQGISVTNGGGGTLSWTATAGAAWIVLSAVSGTAPATLSVSVNPASLALGQSSGTVQISAAGASNSPQTISVSLVTAAPTNLPTISSVVNGASFQPGIESGSWVTVKGANLSNTNPGRTWLPGEIVNGNLPISLDGTSVTINGKTAYVYYISPSQLNVQAPTDSTTGMVPVVVTNNGQVSAAFTAQLQAYAAAFFLYTGTAYAIAQRYPDNALVGNPSVVPGTVAARPGDVLILWGTGFGPTNPPISAGVVVSGAPGVLTLPVVTVGGLPATLINTVLSPGSAGLYQVAIQLPASVPTGAVSIQASVGGVQSPGGILTFVSAQ